MNYLFSSAYWPSLHYFYYALKTDEIVVEQHDHYQKQSYRNRCRILSANGVLDLSIPVHNLSNKQQGRGVLINYKNNWQMNHWRAITSAYRKAPYFEFFEEEICYFYKEKFERLYDYNEAQLITLFSLLRIKKKLTRTESYSVKSEERKDLRELIHPKINFREDPEVSRTLEKPYYQTFSSKFPFQPDLSILDLLFNTGLGVKEYLGGVNG
jgi:hypothetical protein